MDIEKLIERIRAEIRGPGGLLEEAATALSTLRAENEKLRAESIMHHNAADNYWHELNEYRQERNEALAELEQVKRERDAAVKVLRGECDYCKYWDTPPTFAPCSLCYWESTFENITDKDDLWEWIGPRKED